MIIDQIKAISQELRKLKVLEAERKLQNTTVPTKEIDALCEEKMAVIFKFVSDPSENIEDKMLFLYFCVQSNLRVSMDVMETLLFQPLRYSAESTDWLSCWSAFLADRVCKTSLLWKKEDQFALNSEFQCRVLILNAEIIPYLTYLDSPERRSRLLSIWERAYAIARLHAEQVDNETHAEIRQQLAQNLYENYFRVPTYQQFLFRAESLFEEAIKYRLQRGKTEIDIHNEIGTKLLYCEYLLKYNPNKIEKVIVGSVEKLKNKKHLFERKRIYYHRLLCCLCFENIVDQRKYKTNEAKYQESLSCYRQKLEKILHELNSDNVNNDFAKEIGLAKSLLQQIEATYCLSQADFESIMPKSFFLALNYLNNILLNIPLIQKQNLDFFDIFNSIPCDDIKRYFIFHDVARRVFRSIFDNNYQDKKSLDFFYVTVNRYFQERNDLLSIQPDTAENILNFAQSQLEKGDLYYIVFYFVSFNYIASQESSHKLTYREVLKSLYQHLQSKKKYNDFRKIMALLTKLPWHAQEFRTIKSWKILSMFSAMLQMELNTLAQENASMHHYTNVFGLWDNLTAEIEVISQLCPYPPTHIFYEWQFLRTAISQLETIKSEFVGLSTHFDALYKRNFLDIAEKDTRLISKIGAKRCEILFKELREAKVLLKELYEKEQKAFFNFSLVRDNLRTALNLTSCPVFPTDYELKDIYQVFDQNIKDKLKNDQVISLSMLTFSYDRGEGYILISTIIYVKDNKVEFLNHTTDISEQDLQDVISITQNVAMVANNKIINHYSSIYKQALSCGKTKLTWIGVDMLKYFPIQILPIDKSSSKLWFDAWNTIEFASSLRELFQLEIEFASDGSSKKKKIKNLRLFGEKKNSNIYPSLGKVVLDNLCEIDNAPIIEGQPLDLKTLTDNLTFELDYLPEVVSYYGHIESGNYLEKTTGFLSDSKMSNLNRLLSWPELCCIKRLELWGCHGATLFTFDSTELPQYENFAKRFLIAGVKQILTTIKQVPDFAAALIWEHISLSEKTFPDRHISILLKNAIMWYRKTITDLSENVKNKMSLCLKENKELSSNKRMQKQHPYLRKIITQEINRLRSEFRNSLAQNFVFHDFSQNDIDTSILRNGEACYLGRKKKSESVKNEDIDQYLEKLMSNIFDTLISSEIWGAVILINHV